MKDVETQKVASVRLKRMKMEENQKKKTVEAKVVEDELEEDSGYVDLFLIVRMKDVETQKVASVRLIRMKMEENRKKNC